MSTEFKLRLSAVLLILCIAGLAFQGYSLWQMNQRLAANAGSSDIPASIMQRLEPKLQNNAANPFAYLPSGSVADPFARMQLMQQQMDSMFNSLSPFGSFFNQAAGSNWQQFEFSAGAPSMELVETEEEYQLRVQTPPDHELVLNTELEANLLTVSGSLRSEVVSNRGGIGSNVVSSSQFTRSFDLDKPVDAFGLFTEQAGEQLIVRVPKTS